MALLQLLLITFFTLLLVTYVHPLLLSYTQYIFLKLHRYFLQLPTDPPIHPDIIFDRIWLTYYPHRQY